jgi:hypothetical protein
MVDITDSNISTNIVTDSSSTSIVSLTLFKKFLIMHVLGPVFYL